MSGYTPNIPFINADQGSQISSVVSNTAIQTAETNRTSVAVNEGTEAAPSIRFKPSMQGLMLNTASNQLTYVRANGTPVAKLGEQGCVFYGDDMYYLRDGSSQFGVVANVGGEQTDRFSFLDRDGAELGFISQNPFYGAMIGSGSLQGSYVDASVLLIGDTIQTSGGSIITTVEKDFKFNNPVTFGVAGNPIREVNHGASQVSTAVPSLGTASLVSRTVTNTNPRPTVVATLQPLAGSTNWEKVILYCSTNSGTQIIISGYNTGNAATTGNARISYAFYHN